MNLPVTDIETLLRSTLFKNVELMSRNSQLEAENTALRAQLSVLSHPAPEKDSHNSSIPSSRESMKARSVRRTRSLREKSTRPNGGQPGHAGTTLLMDASVDMTITHAPDYCPVCGESLHAMPQVIRETRQSIDIPLPVCPLVTNHVSVEKQCTCGHCAKGSFPSHVKPGVSYGLNLHAVVAYLSVVQHIPFKRLTVVLKDLYGIHMSQGSVSNILNRMRKQSNVGYDTIRKVVEKSAVVGADETGEKLNGELHWMWIFQNEMATYVFQDPSRGKAAIDKHFPKGLPDSCLVTDRHRSYFNMEVESHQICLAHLLRELIYLGELDTGQQWSPRFLELLRETIHKRKTIPIEEIELSDIQKRLEILLVEDLSKLDNKFHALQKSLIKHKDHLFQFLEQAAVPYDNNSSERGVRPLKVKQKISGSFKTTQGADTFCQLHSIVDTARKNNQEPFLALRAIAENS